MKREIKFRVWLKCDEAMIYHDDNDYTLISNGNGFGIVDENWLKDDDYEVMQFTGLKDKNGIEIYEGDILREPAKTEWDEKNFACYECFFHDNDCCDSHIGFQINRMHFHGAVGGGTEWFKCKPKHTAKLEVIGNIYQNKELLTDKHKQTRKE